MPKLYGYKQVKIVVPGAPVAKGRPKFRKIGAFVQAYTPTKTRKAELEIARRYREQVDGGYPKSEHINMTCKFYMPFSSDISKKKRIEWNEEKAHTKRPDLDNLIKLVCDALNGVAFVDDNEVSCIQAFKMYSAEPRTEIYLEYITEKDLTN